MRRAQRIALLLHCRPALGLLPTHAHPWTHERQVLLQQQLLLMPRHLPCCSLRLKLQLQAHC
jgi:hypothetical protein